MRGRPPAGATPAGPGQQNGCCAPPRAPVPSPRSGSSAGSLSQRRLASLHASFTLGETEAGAGPGTRERGCPDTAPDPPPCGRTGTRSGISGNRVRGRRASSSRLGARAVPPQRNGNACAQAPASPTLSGFDPTRQREKLRLREGEGADESQVSSALGSESGRGSPGYLGVRRA